MKLIKGRFVYLERMIVALIMTIFLYSVVAVAEIAALDIISEPSDAEIYINGTYSGSTPMKVSDIPIGNHTFKINKTGYYEWENTVEISDENMTLDMRLEILKGTLEINIEAGIGEVYVDDVYKGLVSWNASLPINLSYGSYVINITRSGCNYWKQTIQVNEQMTRVVSPFNCIKPVAFARKGPEIFFAQGDPFGSYNAGSTLNVDVIITNISHDSPVTLSVLDPYGNWTDLPYHTTIINIFGESRSYFVYDIPYSGPAGTWTVRAAVWDGVIEGGSYQQFKFLNRILIRWNRVAEGGSLDTRYDYKDKTFNVSAQNTLESMPESEIIATPTGNIVYTKVTNERLGQPSLKINAGDEVMWYNEDVILYTIVEIHKKIPDIDLSDHGKAKYMFNKSGNYTFRLYNRYEDRVGKFATPSFQNINVIPPITPVTSPPTSPSISSISTVIENPEPVLTTFTTPPPFKSTQIPASRTIGFEGVLAITGVLAMAYLIRRGF